MKKILTLLCIFLCTFWYSRAQTHAPCGTGMIHDRLLQEDSMYRKNVELFEENTRQFVRDQQAQSPFGKKATVYTIPVVVHVIHLGEPIGTGTNVSDQVITETISGLNKRFRNLIGNGSTDMEVEFCLASIDPNGMGTTGINRVNGSVVANYASGGIDGTGCTNAGAEVTVKNLSRWPSDQYYNIWVVKSICNGGAGGYAYFPGASSSVDGTVVVYNQFGYDDGTLAHELGHGFGLYHTFQGSSGNSCPTNTNCGSDGDKCCDTPPHRQNDCGTTNPCSSAGVWNNSLYNWMAYCLYDWPNQLTYGRFTDNQKSRVQSSIGGGSRLSLTSSGKCGASPPSSCTPPNDNCSGAITLLDTNVFMYTNGTVECATHDSTFPVSSCNSGSPKQQGVFYKFVATGTSTTIVLTPFNITNVGLDAAVVVYSGTTCANLTQIACNNPPGFTYISMPVTGLVKGNTYWIQVYHAGATQPLTGQGRFQICVRKGLSTCNSPAAMVADVSGTDAATLSCVPIGGSGGPVVYKWYKGLTCGGTVVGTDSLYTATQAGYYVCKAYIEGFEATCYSCDPGYATINYSCTSPPVTVNDATGTDSVKLRAIVPGADSSIKYRWYKDSVCTGPVVGTDSVYMAQKSGYYSCMAYVDGYDFVCYSCDKGYATVNLSCGSPAVTVNDATGIDSVQLTSSVTGGSGGTIAYKWYNDSVCGGNVISTSPNFMAKTSGYYSCKAYIAGREQSCYSCDKGYAKVKPYSNDIVMSESGTYTRCAANFYDGGDKNGNYQKGQTETVTILPGVPGSKISVTFNSFRTQISYKDSTDTTRVENDILYVYNGNSTTATQVGALMGKTPMGTITSTATDGSLTFKFVSHKPRVLGDSTSRAGWNASVTCNYQPTDISMLTSGAYVTCGGNFYDGGGATGDYIDNQNQTNLGTAGGTVVTLTPGIAGKKVRVVFHSFATQTQYKDILNQSQSNDDVLSVYNGNSVSSPLLKDLKGKKTVADTVTSTAADGSLTFRFVSNAPFSIPVGGTRAGWAGVISCENAVIIPPPVGLNEFGKISNLKVYPNPANKVLFIVSADIQSGLFSVSLTNLLGQVIAEKEVEVNGTVLEADLDIQHIPDGVYYVTIRSQNENRVFKVQKQTR